MGMALVVHRMVMRYRKGIKRVCIYAMYDCTSRLVSVY